MLQCPVHDALPGCPGYLPPLSFLRCYLSGKWVRSSEGGAISLEQKAQIPTSAFGTQWRLEVVAVWSPLTRLAGANSPRALLTCCPPAEQGPDRGPDLSVRTGPVQGFCPDSKRRAGALSRSLSRL